MESEGISDMRKIVFLIDRNIADYYDETILSIAKFLKPATYEIRDYEDLRRLDIHVNEKENIIFYNFCADYPLEEKLFKILMSGRLINPLDSQKICFNKLKSDMVFRRFRLPVPPAISTRSPEEARRFIARYDEVIFKEKKSCSGAGHFIADKNYAFIGNNRLTYELVDKNDSTDLNIRIDGKRLVCGPPFYLQSFLMPDEPAVWRVYLVDGEAVFFSKRYRDEMVSKKDYIINAARGAKYRLEEKMPAISCHMDAIRGMIADLRLKVATIDFLIHENQAYFLEMDCDGVYTYICRGLKDAKNYEEIFDLDLHIAKMLMRQLK